MDILPNLPMVAIAGGTGDVGKAIVKAFTPSTFSPHFSKVVHGPGTGCMLEVFVRLLSSLTPHKSSLMQAIIAIPSAGRQGCRMPQLAPSIITRVQKRLHTAHLC
jgi:hypothetical protein